jgi:hypothetical protein
MIEGLIALYMLIKLKLFPFNRKEQSNDSISTNE